MDRSVALAIKLTSDPADAAAGFDKAGDAATGMGDKVDKASRMADEGASRLDRAAESSDNLASKSGQATGALGALASGFELVGLEKYAAGLQSASLATDFLSGVGDSLNLITESSIVLKAKDRIATIRSTVATKAQTVATKAQTVAQRLLNLVMKANPILLIVTLIVGLIAVIVLAYKRSETFRKIVDAAFRAVQKAAKFAWDWIKDNWSKIQEFLEKPIDAAREFIIKAVIKIVDTAIRVRDFFKEDIPAAFSKAKDVAVDAMGKILSPIQKVIDLVQDLLDKIGSIDFPDLPSIPGVGNPFNNARAATTDGAMFSAMAAQTTGGAASRSTTSPSITVNISGADLSNPAAFARRVADAVSNQVRLIGPQPGMSGA